MKMTFNVNDALLKRVMTLMGTTNKTHAIDLAMREADRRGQLQKLATAGMGLSPNELASMFDPSYDLSVARTAEGPGLYRTKKKRV